MRRLRESSPSRSGRRPPPSSTGLRPDDPPPPCVCASSCSVARATVRAVASPAMRRATCGSSGRSCLRRRPGRSRAGDRAGLVVVCSSTCEWYESQGDSAQRARNIHVVREAHRAHRHWMTQSRPFVVAMSASLPAASASVHHEGANSSRTIRPPAASAAAMRASACSYGTHTAI